jgi:preprotein translocase subunit SecG
MKLIIVLIHIAVCIALILIVLVQKGKGATMGAAFGGSSQTVFGSSGATSFLQKVTVAAAVIFMFTSLGLALISGRGAPSSIMKGVTPTEVPQQTESSAPATSPAGATSPAAAPAPAQTGTK